MSRGENRITVRGDRPRIALIRLGAMGDCIYTFPLVSALKARFPKADIAWIVEAQHQEIPWLHPGVDDVIAVDTKRWRRELFSGLLGRMVGEFGAIRRSLKAKEFDIALDPQGLIKSGVIAWLTSAPVRIGLARDACREGMNTLFTTHRVDSPDGHIVRKNLSLLTPLEMVIGSPDFGIRLSHDAEAKVLAILQQAGIRQEDWLVGIHPGVGYSRKRWDLDRYAQVGDRLHEREGVQVILTAGPGEEALVRHVALQMRNAPVVMPRLRVEELAALLSRYDLLIAGDTGPLHLAAALGCQTVAIFGPSDSVRLAPVGQGHQVLKKACACG
ncbi:MAG: lipopolysaccharide heptosyltransferase I, partial [Nitrospiraceae bacterium]